MQTRLLQFLLWILILTGGCKREKIRIGLLMDDFSSERWYKDKQFFQEQAKRLGCEVLIDSAMGDADRQYSQAEKMLISGVNVLVVIPSNSEKASAIVDLAHRHHVPVISYDRLIKICPVDFYISFENAYVGELMANYLLQRCPKGNYVIISGPSSDFNSFFVKYGQLVVLQPYIQIKDIKIIFDSTVKEWSENEGYRLMTECLKSAEEPNAVLAANDDLANGVIRALKEAGLAGKVLVSGQDADSEAIKNILSGNQTMTVYKPIETIAFSAVNAVFRLTKKEPLLEANKYINTGKKMVPSILLPSTAVSKDNIKIVFNNNRE